MVPRWRNTEIMEPHVRGILTCSEDAHAHGRRSVPVSKPKVMRLDPTHSVAYIEVGNAASTLLFVHGSLCDHRYWKPQTDALAQHHRVVALSLSHYYPRLPSTEGTPF